MSPNRARPRRRRPLAMLAVGVLAAALGSVSVVEAAASPAAHNTSEAGTIITVAGGLGDGAPATEVGLPQPGLLTMGPDRDLYFGDNMRYV